MSWQVLDRCSPAVPEGAAPVLSDAVREKIRSFFPRYETKRAALLPALHVVQDALGHVSRQAMVEIAEVLEVPPSQVLDTMSFYTHFWDHAKGRKVVVICRSLSCRLLGAESLLQSVRNELGIDEHGTTKDGAYSLLTEECLAACDHGPCMLINEKLHKCVRPEQVAAILKDAKNAQIGPPRSLLFDKPAESAPGDADLPKTSDIQEMKTA